MAKKKFIYFNVFLFLTRFVNSVEHNFDIFPPLPDNITKSDNVVCSNQLAIYHNGLKNLSLWAYEMRTAKSVTGLLRGNIFQFGSFDECLDSNAPFQIQYCLTTIKAVISHSNFARDPKSLFYLPDEFLLRKLYAKSDRSQQQRNLILTGWCVPASCSPMNLKQNLNKYLNDVQLHIKNYNVTYTAYLNDDSCQKQDEFKKFDQLDISFCLVALIVCCTIILSTVGDVILQRHRDVKANSTLENLVCIFSILQNLKQLSKSKSSDSLLQILHGARIFCICMIIMDHRFGTTISSGVMNFNIVEEQYRSTIGHVFFHGDLFVDSFFVLSGFLVTYFVLLQYRKKFVNPLFLLISRYVRCIVTFVVIKENANIPHFCQMKLLIKTYPTLKIRLTPIYAFVIFYYATILNYTGNGPMWKTIITPEVHDCRKNWWLNLLYVNNYFNAEQMCMVHSWYLPCDFHYFMVAVMICVLINRSQQKGIVVLVVIGMLSIVVPFLIIFFNHRPGILYFFPEFLRSPKTDRDFLLTYIKSHMRASPYFIGMISGYLYFKLKNKERKLQLVNLYIIFVVSLLLIIGSIFSGAIFYDPYYEPNDVISSAYFSLHRGAWSVGSVGILYIISRGQIKWLYNVLAWKPWATLSKLVYGSYLIHMQLQLRAVAAKVSSSRVTYFDIISSSLSDILLSFGMSFLLYIAIEAPSRNLFTLVLVRKTNGHHTSSKEVENNPTIHVSHL